MRLDHIVLAAGPGGLAGTTERLSALLGEEFRGGGIHPRFGTQNNILPLAGGRYVEVVAVLDHPAADKAPFGQAVRSRSVEGGGWLGWVVEVEDLAPFEQRLGRRSVPGHRVFPDGRCLEWHQIGVKGLIADPQLPFATIRSMREVQAAAFARQRFLMALLAGLAAVAVALAAIGIHGLIAASVTERRREMGIRLALGASMAQAVRTLVLPGVALSVAGTAIGAMAAVAFARSASVGTWPLKPPSFAPRTLAAASAAFVLAEIASASASATQAMIPTVSLFASGMSQATNSIPASLSESRNAAFLASLSSFAITSVALQSRQRSSAFASTGFGR